LARSFREVELAGWTSRAASYDRLFAPITNQIITPVLRALGPLNGRKVLDVCCGPGHLAAAIAANGAAVEGVDLAATMVARARANHPTLRFAEADAEALPYDGNTFDHVVCAFGVMHLTHADGAMAEAFRVLRPGGRYLFTQWARDDDVLNIVSTAIAEHGAPVPDLPPAPPPMRFSDPAACRQALKAVGFADLHDEHIAIAWTAERPEAVLELIYGGAVRVAMILEAQAPERRARIHDEILAAARSRMVGGKVELRRPAVLASGTKPEA
jgi:ubiquinone/menaquinone biosynthesis C-methylase UbiE